MYDQPVVKDLEFYNFFIGIYFLFFGLLHSLKEFFLCLVSFLTGITVIERQKQFSDAYFKSRVGAFNPFDKVRDCLKIRGLLAT